MTTQASNYIQELLMKQKRKRKEDKRGYGK
jgi:hypothetical protein